MRSGLRAVWDTNVLISAFLLRGRSSLLVQALFANKITLFVSEPILKEYFEVAIRPKFGRSFAEIKRLLQLLTPHMVLVTPKTRLEQILTDPVDLKFIECALEAKAGYLVTGDKSLLALRRYQRVKIVSVQTFLRRVR